MVLSCAQAPFHIFISLVLHADAAQTEHVALTLGASAHVRSLHTAARVSQLTGTSAHSEHVSLTSHLYVWFVASATLARASASLLRSPASAARVRSMCSTLPLGEFSHKFCPAFRPKFYPKITAQGCVEESELLAYLIVITSIICMYHVPELELEF